MARHIDTILRTNYNHVDNNHKPLLKEQLGELRSAYDLTSERYDQILSIFDSMDSNEAKSFIGSISKYGKRFRSIRKAQIKRIKNHEVGTRNSLLYLSHLGEFRNLVLFSNRIIQVFDELILDPTDEGQVLPKSIKEELRKMDETESKRSIQAVKELDEFKVESDLISDEEVSIDKSNVDDDESIDKSDVVDDNEIV